jgi:hypothetical protein
MKISPDYEHKYKGGYCGYFPGFPAVKEFHFKSMGVSSGYVDIRVYIEKGEYDGYRIIRKDKGEKHGE